MIYEVLTQIQTKLKAPKGQYNSFGKYNYRSCEDILEALKPVLSEHKASVILSDEIIEIGGRFYVKATATLYAGGESCSATAQAREDAEKKGMDGSQITGTASSYARKYALNGLFAIDDTKDADTGVVPQNTQPAPVLPQIPAQQEQPKEYKCIPCGKVFEGFTDKNGKFWNAGQVYHMAQSSNTDGQARCRDCSEAAGTRKPR
jgi:DNA-directed RNA polymerase subunit RPC12/RpoP